MSKKKKLLHNFEEPTKICGNLASMKRFNLALATRDVHEQPPDP
jgi:hypothetical protein